MAPSQPLEPQVSKCQEKSEIAEFYAGTNVLVTGGTGFLGKLLIEKLLRSCPRITKIYMLVRPKRGKSSEERFEENFKEVIYDRLRKEQPNFLNKIVMVEAELSQEDFGMTPEVNAMLMDTNIIFHSAATVRFFEKLRVAVNTNVRTTKCLLLWASKLTNLKAFVYVSTAFSNCVNSTIEEKHYKHTMDSDTLITLANCLNDDQLLAMESILRGKAPNNYTLSKAAAENAVLKYGDGLPVAIVRPSIIIATAQEPVRAWINNYYGATGAITGICLGILHTFHVKPYNKAELIPADYAAANIIAAAWNVGTRECVTKMEQDSMVCDEDRIPIYNAVSSADNPITWYQFIKSNEIEATKTPSMKASWYILFIYGRCYIMYHIYCFLLHTIPAIIGDTMARLMGRKPMLMNTYRKEHIFIDILQYFSTNQWELRNENVKKLWSKLNSVDRILFNFNTENLDWKDYCRHHWNGLRVYLLNDPMDSVEQARVRYNKLRVAHYTVMAIFSLLVLWIAVFLVPFLWLE